MELDPTTWLDLSFRESLIQEGPQTWFGYNIALHAPGQWHEMYGVMLQISCAII